MSHHTHHGSLPYPKNKSPPSYNSVWNDDDSSTPTLPRSTPNTTSHSAIQQQSKQSVCQSHSCQCQCHETHASTSSEQATAATLPSDWTYYPSRCCPNEHLRNMGIWQSVQSGARPVISYGISKYRRGKPELDNGPGDFFTCTFKPRRGPSNGKTHTEIDRANLTIARSMSRHRRENKCCCTFEGIHDVCGSRFSAWVKRILVRRHDKVCACGCFAVRTRN